MTEQDSKDTVQNDRANALRQAYGKATARVREAHRDEFEAAYVEEAAALGVEYKPRPSAEQKAEEQLAALLAEYPHLAEKVTQGD